MACGDLPLACGDLWTFAFGFREAMAILFVRHCDISSTKETKQNEGEKQNEKSESVINRRERERVSERESFECLLAGV